MSVSLTASVLLLLFPLGAFAAKSKTETFRVEASKERAYVAAVLAVQNTDNMVVVDASLSAGSIKAMHPRFNNDMNVVEITLTESGPAATDVVVTYSEPGQLIGFFLSPVAAEVRKGIERRLTETTPRLAERYPDVPDRLIVPRPGTAPPWLSHSEEVATSGSLDEIREAMERAVDSLGNAHKNEGRKIGSGDEVEDHFRLYEKDVDQGLFVFLRGRTNREPAPGFKNRAQKQMIFSSYNQVVTFRVIGGAKGLAARSRRVRITLDLDYTDGEARLQTELKGVPQKLCRELRDAFLGQQSQTVSLGQSQEEVEAILGKPKQVVNLGTKRILVYDNLKITLIDGKVRDVQ